MKRLVALGLGLCISALSAHAVTVQAVDNDAALTALLGGAGEPLVVFVGEGRIGGPGTFEYDVGLSTAAPAQNGNLNWTSGENFVFSFDYNSTSGLVTLSFGSNANLPGAGELQLVGAPHEAQFNAGAGLSITDLFIRARANDGTSVLFEDLQLKIDGGSLFDVPDYQGNFSSLYGGAYRSPAIARVGSEPFSQGFTLGGSVALNFDPLSPPQNSQLAFQFKVAAVPEGEALLLLVAGLAAVVTLRRRTANAPAA